MRTAIIYASKHGTSGKVADIISGKLSAHDVTVYSLAKNGNPDIGCYDLVIIGGPIYAGNPLDAMKKFCEKNLSDLLQKKVGLYLCCMNKAEQQSYMENSFPEELRKHSSASVIAGGEMILENMSFFERLIVRFVAKTKKSVSAIDYQAIDKFVEEIK
ncbi:flavodoxin domain-containing protein [Cytophagaceae bacterium ABcell3]|nr:flavodoxin domain-containing protein [Cytophagaceae bacterium ABcell3]